MSELSRRLFLKLAGAAGVALALPDVTEAAPVEQFTSTAERIPVFEYFDRGQWVEIGNVIDVNMRSSVDLIEVGDGRPPRKGITTTTMEIEYLTPPNDPFSELDRERFDVRIYIPDPGYRFTCERAMAVEYSFSSSGKSVLKLIGGLVSVDTAVAA